MVLPPPTGPMHRSTSRSSVHVTSVVRVVQLIVVLDPWCTLCPVSRCPTLSGADMPRYTRQSTFTTLTGGGVISGMTDVGSAWYDSYVMMVKITLPFRLNGSVVYFVDFIFNVFTPCTLCHALLYVRHRVGF